MNRRMQGMTLLELLVALAVFSLIATAAYAGLREGTRVSERLDRQRATWQQLESVQRLISDDLTAARIVPGGGFAGYGDRGAIAAGVWLELTRGVALEFRDGAASPYRTIRYLFEDGALRRAGADAAAPDELLQGITKARARYLDAARQWHEAWPPEGATTITTPRALELIFTLAGQGELRWVFHVGLTP